MTDRTFTVDDVDAEYQPTMVRASICLATAIVLEIERLQEQLQQARKLDEREKSAVAQWPAIAQQIIDLQARAREHEREFVFKGIGRRDYTNMIRAHPPTDEQKSVAAENGLTAMFDSETFPPACMAASCVVPTGSSEAWWRRKYDEWTIGQIERLWQACLAANAGVAEVPKADEAYAMINGSALSSG